ncbi:uncharacterized protein LOC135370680 [Ornithodoros turicata]|uniref:uncharacterized protein LOC135370680 n=1 Tax=Ornithodoros turicata TaxID=34597 RepID=UPI003139BAFA
MMKFLACLVLALYATGSGAAGLPKKIQFGTYVLYDTSVRRRSTTGIGVYTKLLFNAINARLPFNVTGTQIELVLIGMKEVSDNAIVLDPNGYPPLSVTAGSLFSYVSQQDRTGGRDNTMKNADIVLYFSGTMSRAARFNGKYYNAWSPGGTICTRNNGVTVGLYNPDFDKMESIMFGILRLLGSDETGGVAANLNTKSRRCLNKKPRGVYSNVTKLPGEDLDGTVYCKEFASDSDAFSLCETLNDGCTLSCCWNNNVQEFRRTSAPDGFGCGKRNSKICFMDKCVPRRSLGTIGYKYPKKT